MKLKAKTPALFTKGVKFNISVIRAKTGKLEKVVEGLNLILDSGLSLWGNNETGQLTRYCAVGDSTDPTNRDSGSVTASRTGTTVSTGGAASFFEASDVGRLIKWDSGEEAYITTFTGTDEVETDSSGVIAGGEFTIHYVDDTILGNELERTGDVRTEGGDNQSTESAGVITMKRTHLFPAVGAGVTYEEIGWSTSATTNASLFNRALITGGVTLLSGDQLLVESNLEIVQGPQTSTTSPDVGGGGFNSEGDIQLEGYGLTAIQSSGNVGGIFDGMDNSSGVLEPSVLNESVYYIAIGTQTTAFSSYGNPPSLSPIFKHLHSRGGIVTEGPSSRSRTVSCTLSTDEGNSTNINWIGLTFGGSNYVGARVRLDAAQTKLNTETLALAFKKVYGRILSN